MSDWQPSGEAVTLANAELDQMSKNERIKVESQGLFYVSTKGGVHPFLDELESMVRGDAETIGNEAKELSKFFGIYKQQTRGERGRKTQDFSFMVRIKAPAGGFFDAQQWAALDEAADLFADSTLRITSRQGIQYHGVKGDKLGKLVRQLNRGYRGQGTLGACGDVNRNVMASPIEELDPEHQTGGRGLAEAIAAELAPRSSAYFQIFRCDDEGRNQGALQPDEPLYGKQYLPRKFKVGLAHPGDNAVDVLTQDVGFVPVSIDGTCDGSVWDLYSGGGLGLTHNNPKTAALLGLYLGRVRREQVVEVCRALATIQKENGERKDRKLARWKYTIRRMGADAVKAALRERFGIRLVDAEPAPLPPNEFALGWHAEAGDGDLWWLGLPVLSGRLRDRDGERARSAVRAIVSEIGTGVRCTANQDLLLCHIPGDRRDRVEELLAEHGVDVSRAGATRRQALACPAKPTCGLAMTDAENSLPVYLDHLEAEGLGEVDVVIRIAGCPNSCSRPPTAEIGIIGYGKNDHQIQVGGTREGDRIGHTLYPRVPESDMKVVLTGLLRAIREHGAGQPAGEFLRDTDPDQLRAWVGSPS
jgi:sulfite reductase (ferredoxin)